MSQIEETIPLWEPTREYELDVLILEDDERLWGRLKEFIWITLDTANVILAPSLEEFSDNLNPLTKLFSKKLLLILDGNFPKKTRWPPEPLWKKALEIVTERISSDIEISLIAASWMDDINDKMEEALSGSSIKLMGKWKEKIISLIRKNLL